MVRTLCVFALAGLPAVACSPAKAPAEADGAAIAARAEAMAPADPRLARLYSTSCHACHGRAGSGAPLAGDLAAWEARWGKGEATLLASVIAGKGGMPAGGQCFACTAEDYKALVRFMAGRSRI